MYHKSTLWTILFFASAHFQRFQQIERKESCGVSAYFSIPVELEYITGNGNAADEALRDRFFHRVLTAWKRRKIVAFGCGVRTPDRGFELFTAFGKTGDCGGNRRYIHIRQIGKTLFELCTLYVCGIEREQYRRILCVRDTASGKCGKPMGQGFVEELLCVSPMPDRTDADAFPSLFSAADQIFRAASRNDRCRCTALRTEDQSAVQETA